MSFLFGGKKNDDLKQVKPIGFSGGGITATPSGNTITVSSNADRQGLVSDIQRTFGEQASQIGQLRSQVTPGFGRLTQSRLAEIESGRRRTIGNLAQNLQQRRIFGSSFAQASLAQAEREFAQASEEAAAESFLQELEINSQLLSQEFEARTGAFKVALEDLNLQAEIGASLAQQATGEMGANARLQAQLNAQSSAGLGKLFGTIAQIGLGFATGGASVPLSVGASAAAAGGVGLL